MKVLLKRNLFLGGSRYRVNPNGTEIPNIVDGREVCLFSEENVKNPKKLVLPRDAELYDEKKAETKPVEVVPVALSQLAKASVKTPLDKP